MEFTIPMAAFRSGVVTVARDIDDDLAREWSRQVLDDTRNIPVNAVLNQDDVWTYAHQAFPDIPDFGTPLRNRIVAIMERLADALGDERDRHLPKS